MGEKKWNFFFLNNDCHYCHLITMCGLVLSVKELLPDRPAVAASAIVPRSWRSQSREPAMLRTPPVPSRTPTGTSNLESPAPPSWPAGSLTFHPLCIHNGARDETSTGSLLCSCVSCDATLEHRLILQLQSWDY